MKNLPFLCILAVFSAQAIEVNVTNVNCGTVPGTPTSGVCGDLTTDLRSAANADLPEVGVQKYADGTANSTYMANSGKGSDYSQNFDLFTIKITPLALGIDASDGGFSDPENASGIAIGAGLMAGINLNALPISKIGFLDLSKLDLMINGMSFNIQRDITDEVNVDGKVAGFGISARYRLLDSVSLAPMKLLEWGGVHLHAGYQSATMDTKFGYKIDDQTVTSGPATATLQNGLAIINIESSTQTIPLEISTYMRLGYVFTVYGGMGLDLVSGESKISLGGSGDIAGTGGYSADLSANQSSNGEPEGRNARYFVGLQLNVPVVSLYLHVNKLVGSDVAGLNIGANVAW